jgi:uncharacterized membrane protein YcaP (DUF421 family)
MPDYVSILDPIPWKDVLTAMLQTVVIYWFAIIGLKMIGIHVFGQPGPQHLLLLLLLVSGMSGQMIPSTAGFWGCLGTGLALLITAGITQKIPPLRRFVKGKPVLLMEENSVDHQALKKTLVDEAELDKTAHQYGIPNKDGFQTVRLESDGRVTGVLKPEYLQNRETRLGQKI